MTDKPRLEPEAQGRNRIQTPSEQVAPADQHTPGPWIVGSKSGEVLTPITGKPGSFSALCWENDDGLIEFRSPGDARLIAAAPDMLAVLQRIRDSYPGYIPDFIEAVNAAIAKAEGTTER